MKEIYVNAVAKVEETERDTLALWGCIDYAMNSAYMVVTITNFLKLGWDHTTAWPLH